MSSASWLRAARASSLNKRRKLRAAPALLFVLLLTACKPDIGDFADFEAANKEYLDYALGPDHQILSKETEMYPDGTYVCHNRVQYDQKTLGKQRTFNIDAFSGGYPLTDFTEKQHDDYDLLNSLYPEASAAAVHEFADTILSNYFRVPEFGQTLQMNPLTGVYIEARVYCALPLDKTEGIPMTEAALKPETGLQVCTASLRSIAQDQNVIPVLEIKLTEREGFGEMPKNPERYTEIMDRIYQDYMQAAESPVNYRFAVAQTWTDSAGITESEQILYDRASLVGLGEFDASERYQTANFMIGREMQRELKELLIQN